MRAIDADTLTKQIVTTTEEAFMNASWKQGMNYALGLVKVQATIQPKRGKWIKTARWGRVYYCDQCRNYLDFDGVNVGRGSTNYCPNCGCRMDGGEQE